MKIKGGKLYICPGSGPLLTPESGECVIKDDALTEAALDSITVWLIDNDD